MLLLIDNYDSFTYNLYQYLASLGIPVQVMRNDALSLQDIDKLAPSHMVISPGPGTPDTAGISLAAIEHVAGKIPLLGVCLGHQAIGQVFGARVVRAKKVMHGKTSAVFHDDTGLLHDLPNPFIATRYHSLLLAPDSLPDCLTVNAWAEDAPGQQEIMGITHKTWPIYGVQFHPESILTPQGMAILRAFVKRA